LHALLQLCCWCMLCCSSVAACVKQAGLAHVPCSVAALLLLQALLQLCCSSVAALLQLCCSLLQSVAALFGVSFVADMSLSLS
jgi:putative effector of murein hydrolase LrgA (UPF0299 family)